MQGNLTRLHVVVDKSDELYDVRNKREGENKKKMIKYKRGGRSTQPALPFVDSGLHRPCTS